jgi:hypothetical protein
MKLENLTLADMESRERLWSKITTEDLLLAAIVLSIQNPQGADLNRKKLMRDALALVDEALGTLLWDMPYENSGLSQLMRKFGYPRYRPDAQPDAHQYVPYGEAACQITGLKSRRDAIKRLDRYVEGSELSCIRHMMGWWGIRPELIPELATAERKQAEIRNRAQKRASAQRPRPSRKGAKKNFKKKLDPTLQHNRALR